MTRARLIQIATAGSAALLLGAFAFQYIGGFRPCELCLLQRWPHAVAVLIGVLALLIRGAAFPALGALTMAASAGLGLYHSGVERHWWEGPTACSSTMTVAGQSPADLLNQIMAAPIVRCDEIAWQFAGLSMANMNTIASVLLALIWFAALRRR